MITTQKRILNYSDLQEMLPKLAPAIEYARDALISQQKSDGHWCYEFEADSTIPSEYILMMHFLGDINQELEKKITVYLRAKQNEEGGWPLYYGGETDISCTVKAYYALKLAGEDINAPYMQKARELILRLGGAAKSNVFTRIALAMFEQIPWRGVPFIPVEIMLLPRWFPFHLSKVSYWSRTVMVPLFILYSFKAKAKNPLKIDIQELFVRPPDQEKNYFQVRSTLNRAILFLERIGFHLQFLAPSYLKRKAMKKAEAWMIERLNGTSGLGAIFPAMVNAYEALILLGYPQDHVYVSTAREAIDRLLVVREEEAYCQPCVSPVWDTLLAGCALQEVGDAPSLTAADQGMDWLISKQLIDAPGDWQERNPSLPNGSWPFQYENPHYPDLDDTAFAAYALHRADNPEYRRNIERAAQWLAGLQSRNGGFAAFDADNTYYYLNEIPFADHGALLDPPTEDVSARCLMFFGLIVQQYPEYRQTMDACMKYLSHMQEEDGAWFGRWGTNYIYGTWSVLFAFETAGLSKEDPRIRKAVNWLISMQNTDGGWGEDNFSYHNDRTRGTANNSTAFQTAWALLGLMAAGETRSDTVAKGIDYLLQQQTEDGQWHGPEFTAPGFPRVFYLIYHGYNKYFPLWALSRYRNEIQKMEA